jgi:Flp pilus assembly pilin Flp
MPPTTPQLHDESGQTLAEYSVLVAFVAIVVAVVLPAFGVGVAGLFDGVRQALGG